MKHHRSSEDRFDLSNVSIFVCIPRRCLNIARIIIRKIETGRRKSNSQVSQVEETFCEKRWSAIVCVGAGCVWWSRGGEGVVTLKLWRHPPVTLAARQVYERGCERISAGSGLLEWEEVTVTRTSASNKWPGSDQGCFSSLAGSWPSKPGQFHVNAHLHAIYGLINIAKLNWVRRRIQCMATARP